MKRSSEVTNLIYNTEHSCLIVQRIHDSIYVYILHDMTLDTKMTPQHQTGGPALPFLASLYAAKLKTQCCGKFVTCLGGTNGVAALL